MLSSSVNHTRSNISSEYAKALLAVVAIDAHAFRVKQTLAKGALLQGLTFNKATPISSFGCWLLEKEISTVKVCL